MGFPIRTNIFSERIDNSWIKKFPVQMIVLFSPGDREFLTTFKELFLDLDQLTGHDVIFFAVLDPPDDWIKVANNRKEWPGYWKQQSINHSMDDRMLVEEIASKFNVLWSELPVIIVSTNLWNAEYIAFRTSPLLITGQMQALKKLAQKSRESFDLDIGYIAKALSDRSAVKVTYNPPNFETKKDLARFYEILDSENQPGIVQYWDDIYFRYFNRSRNNNQYEIYDQPQKNNLAFDSLQRFNASLLVPFVARSEIEHERFLEQQYKENSELAKLDVDDESWTMMSRALRIGRFIDELEHNQLVIGNNDYRRTLEDYSPAAQGLWKGFEREINLSIVQAFRNARTISMPKYFARFCPDFAGNSIIKTPKNKVDINRLDWDDPAEKRHRFLELGPAYHCTKAMMGNTDEVFDQVILNCLEGSQLPDYLLIVWKEINQIRNPPSHTELLSREGFARIIDMVLKDDNLSVLTRIKRALS
jgi:hypothetical protein